MSQKYITTAWAGFIAILAIIFIAGWMIFNNRFQHILSLSSDEAEKELLFVSDLVKEKLLKREYQETKDFIQHWGKRISDISEITLTTENGYELAHYLRSLPTDHKIIKQTDILYSYDKQVHLNLTKSQDEIYSSYRVFLLELIAGYIFIVIIFYYLTYTLVRIQKQKLALRLENLHRLRAEEKLEKVNVDLQEREKNLAITLNSIGDAVIVTNARGEVTRMNPVAEKLTGWTLSEALGQPLKTIFTIIDASSREVMGNPVEKVISTGETVYLSNHTLLLARDGSEYHIADSAAPIRQDDNAILGIVLVFNDVSERKRSEEKIRTLYQAIEQSPVSVMITDQEANIEYVNSTFEKNTGYCLNEVIGQNSRILKSGKTSREVYQDMWNTILEGNAWQGELLNRRKSGELFWESAHIAPVEDEDGITRHFLAVREDITLRKNQEEKILHQAHFDALTDLPNRFLSLDRLSQLIIEAKRNKELVAVVFLDLDDFKKINDTLGHDIGDKLLIEAADRLHAEVRSGDTVGRLGGDEFIILLGGLSSASDASPIVENLLNQFRDAFKVDGRELMLTASVGVAVYPDDGDTPSELLRNSDSAMYHAKEDGRNTYSFFTDTMNQEVSRRLILEEQMHGALDRGEFSLCYQPKVDIATRDIIGAEALLRWNNPALGNVPPAEFIPIAEQTGLIVTIGKYVISEALEKATDWKKSYKLPFVIAINLSPRQFRDPGLMTFIQEAIDQSGIPGDSVELEITEGVLMGGHSYIKNALYAISELGISIALDDFGTGYSSLNYLRRYPFDVLKIDRSFVSDIASDKADRELVNASIAMAHSLGLKVVAEGVETEEQLNLLAEQGCEIAQGYYFSKPVPASKISVILSTGLH